MNLQIQTYKYKLVKIIIVHNDLLSFNLRNNYIPFINKDIGG